MSFRLQFYLIHSRLLLLKYSILSSLPFFLSPSVTFPGAPFCSAASPPSLHRSENCCSPDPRVSRLCSLHQNRTPDPLLSCSLNPSNPIRDDDATCPAHFRCCAPGSSLPRHPSSPPSSLFYLYLFLFYFLFLFFLLLFLLFSLSLYFCPCLQLSCYDSHPQDPSFFHFLPLVWSILVQPHPIPHHGSRRQEDSG